MVDKRSKKQAKKPKKPKKCPSCGDKAADISWGPNPFTQDIHGDDTPVWMCGECRYHSAMDI